MIIKTMTTSHSIGNASINITTAFEQDDKNGQHFVRGTTVLASGAMLELRHTIGSDDGNDALSAMTPLQISTVIQTTIDNLRSKILSRLTVQNNIQSAASVLQ